MLNGIEFFWRQFRFERNPFFLQHSNRDGYQRIGTFKDLISYTYLHAIPGVIHLRDRRVQADRQAVSKFLNKGSHSLVDEVILSGFEVRAVNGRGLI